MVSLARSLESYRKKYSGNINSKQFEVLRRLQERIRNGESTCNEITDFSIIYMNGDLKLESRLRELYDKMSRNEGELILTEMHYNYYKPLREKERRVIFPSSKDKNYRTIMKFGIIKKPFIDLSQKKQDTKYPIIKLTTSPTIIFNGERSSTLSRYNDNKIFNLETEVKIDQGIEFRMFLYTDEMLIERPRGYYDLDLINPKLHNVSIELEKFALHIGDEEILSSLSGETFSERRSEGEFSCDENGDEFYSRVNALLKDEVKFDEFKIKIA